MALTSTSVATGSINDASRIRVINGDPAKDPQVAKKVAQAIAEQNAAKVARSRAGSGGNAQAEYNKEISLVTPPDTTVTTNSSLNYTPVGAPINNLFLKTANQIAEQRVQSLSPIQPQFVDLANKRTQTTPIASVEGNRILNSDRSISQPIASLQGNRTLYTSTNSDLKPSFVSIANETQAVASSVRGTTISKNQAQTLNGRSASYEVNNYSRELPKPKPWYDQPVKFNYNEVPRGFVTGLAKNLFNGGLITSSGILKVGDRITSAPINTFNTFGKLVSSKYNYQLNPFNNIRKPIQSFEKFGFRPKEPITLNEGVSLAILPISELGAFGFVGSSLRNIAFAGLSLPSIYEGTKGIYNSKNSFDVGVASSSFAFAGLALIPIAKQSFIGFGSKFELPNKVFDTRVLANEIKMPLTSSIKKSINLFESTRDISSGKIYGSTASPQKLSGFISKESSRSINNMEDNAISVTAKGFASPAFLKIVNEDSAYGLNKDSLFATPTITEFSANDIVQYPRKEINIPGFRSQLDYQKESLSSKGVILITKRSEIGQGEISKKLFVSDKGKLIREFGTSEQEGTIPLFSQYKYDTPKSFIGKIKGFDSFTSYNGELVIIRKAEILNGNNMMLVENFKNNNVIEKNKNYNQKNKYDSYSYSSSPKKNPIGFTLNSKISSKNYNIKSIYSLSKSLSSGSRSSSSGSSVLSSLSSSSRSSSSSSSSSTGSSSSSSSSSRSSSSGSSVLSSLSSGKSNLSRLYKDKIYKYKQINNRTKNPLSTKYTPSLYAQTFNIKASKYKIFDEFSGLGVRGL